MARHTHLRQWFLYHASRYDAPLSLLDRAVDYPAEVGRVRVCQHTYSFLAPIAPTPYHQSLLWFTFRLDSGSDAHGRHIVQHHSFADVPYDDELFCWAVYGIRQIKGDIPLGVAIPGQEIQPIIQDHLLPVGKSPLDEPPPIAPVWCPVANMVTERHAGAGGQEVWRGSKHFQPGTKLYLQSGFWGMGGESVTVVGRHRGSHKYVTMVVRSEWLENWHADLVYSPHVISQLWLHWDGSTASKASADKIAQSFNRYNAEHPAQQENRAE